MRTDGLKVGIIGLGEAGNLGDDLILIATVEAIYRSNPTAEITYLSHGQTLDWDQLTSERGYPRKPHGIPQRFEIPVIRQNKQCFADCDVIVFGGGGLLQTSHSSNRPYGWLSYLPKTGLGKTRVMATGLGLGPISDFWTRKLRKMGSPFDLLWVRDSDSANLATDDLNWPVKKCRDFVDEEFLGSFPESPRKVNYRDKKLGVALRKWPDFSVENAVQYIKDIALKEDCDEIVFFVLECNRGGGIDVEFSRSIAARLDIPNSVKAYRPEQLSSFISDMHNIDVAISMKLHSSAIWAARNIPLYPIVYAPKVAAFFGMPYRGFEVCTSTKTVSDESFGSPRASETIAEGIAALVERTSSSGARFSSVDRFKFQSIRLYKSASRRILSQIKIKK